MAPGWGSRRQRSAVKVAYVENRKAGAWRAHGTYLARDGAQRQGEKGLGFNTRQDGLDIPGTLGAWQQAGDLRLWKAIVSPEQAARLDLREHARALVTQMERDLETTLEWVAIDHQDTDHPHVHLLVRGHDDQGTPLTIDPAYVQRGIRERSEELATRALGLRTEHEILASRERAVERVQFTELDRRIVAKADGEGCVRYVGGPPKDRLRRRQRLVELRRLGFLLTLGLATRSGSRAWVLSRELEPTLRQAQLASDIIKSRARHQAHVSDPRIPVVVTRIEAGTRLAGRVVGTGLADELRDQRYLLVEGTDRRLHYIVQTPEMQAARGQARLRMGDRVVLNGRAVAREGRTIVRTDIDVQPAAEGPSERPTGRRGPALERPALPTLDQLEYRQGRPICVLTPVGGLTYRGRLLGYARARNGQRYAVLDTGRELSAFRTDDAARAPGLELRATGREAPDGRGDRVRAWRLDLAQRERQRGRGR